MLLKLGLPPLHLWFIRLARVIKLKPFMFIITLHKMLPVLILRKAISTYLSTILGLSLIIFSSLTLFSSGVIFLTIIYSSIIHNLWMILRRRCSLGMVLLYWRVYSITFISLVWSLLPTKLVTSRLNQSNRSRLCWLLLSGLPPFLVFWLKVHVLSAILVSFGVLIRIFLIRIRVLAMRSYYRVWHFSDTLIRIKKKESSLIFVLLFSFFGGR